MDYSDASSVMAAYSGVYAVSALCGIIGVVGMWKLFLKAGQPGWAAIVPIYNAIVLFRVINRPWWWLFLMLIPIANIVFLIIAMVDLGKSFGKGGAWSFFLLILLSFVGVLVLAFGKSEYRKIER